VSARQSKQVEHSARPDKSLTRQLARPRTRGHQRRGLVVELQPIGALVFHDGELHPISTMVDTLESAGFEVRDVESLREHYADTLRAWVHNLERNWDQAVALSSPGRARVWRLYMAGSALAFQSNRLGVNQVLAVKPGPGGSSELPRTRAALLGDPRAHH